MRPPHTRTTFILLHLAFVFIFGGLLAFSLGSLVPPFILALAPLLGLAGANPRDRRTYWISTGTALLVVGVAVAGLLYLAIANFARGRW